MKGYNEERTGGIRMKKLIAAWAVLTMIFAAGCAKQEAPASSTPAAEETVLVKVNTDGLGEIAVSETGETPAFDDQYPMSSAFTHVKKGGTVALNARGRDDWQFVKWTKDGEYFAQEAEITAAVEADTEFVAVFAVGSTFTGPAVDDIKDAKTMADVLALPSNASSMSEHYYALHFELNGNEYRAVSFIDKDTAAKVFALDFDDPEYDKKHNEIIAPLPIDRIDNLTEMIPSQEEMDKSIGKTAGELLDEGWRFYWCNLQDKQLGMTNGLFSYTLGYEGELQPGIEADEETVRPLKITSVGYDGLGDIGAGLDKE